MKVTTYSNPINKFCSRFSQWTENRECYSLNKRLMNLVHGQKDVADRLIHLEKINHPAHSQTWYLEKIIYDLQRGR